MSSNLSVRNLSTSSMRQIVSLKEQVNGIDVHYEKTGKGDHPILLLPGALGCSRTDFEHQLNGLSEEKYTLIAMDPRGCGKSRPPDRDWPVNFLQRDAEDGASLMKALSYPRYSVLGWSDGANSSMILSAANPGNVISLVIWGGNSYVSDHDMKLYKAIENLEHWSPRMKKPFVDLYGEEYFQQMWAGWCKVQQEIFSKRNGDICIGSLPNIKCSTLLVNGVKDALVPQEQPLFLEKHIVNCRMVTWPEGKHNLHIRYSEEFNALAEEFLDKEFSQQL
ncbi:hypothetical protein RRG08_025426 [Elysia crispata]|uniref:AB hydrolase-1 domain-containing protein n=1 Tax=Elysia crispata TaxID=231223 RepID=A0AAE0Z939_9GAST|nr:hypothetical protein RRG08_025426 [Elysia crispata]